MRNKFEKYANCKCYGEIYETSEYKAKIKTSNGICMNHSPIAKGLNIRDRYPETFSESWCGDWKKK